MPCVPRYAAATWCSTWRRPHGQQRSRLEGPGDGFLVPGTDRL